MEMVLCEFKGMIDIINSKMCDEEKKDYVDKTMHKLYILLAPLKILLIRENERLDRLDRRRWWQLW